MKLRRNDYMHGNNYSAINYEEELDDVDLSNYKGMYFNEEDNKYQDPITGAHFDYYDMCCRLLELQRTTYDLSSVNSFQLPLKLTRKPVNGIRKIFDCRKEKESRNTIQQDYLTIGHLHNNKTITKHYPSNSEHKNHPVTNTNSKKDTNIYKLSNKKNYLYPSYVNNNNLYLNIII